MELIANPSLAKQIIKLLEEEYKIIKPLPHLTELIYCLTRSYFDRVEPLPPTEREVLLFSVGFGLEKLLLSGLRKPLIGMCDGVSFTPDFFSFTDVPGELKTTRSSSKKFGSDFFPETWKRQILGYMYCLHTEKYELAVLHLMGNYCLAPDTPVLMADLTWRNIGDLSTGESLIGVDEYPKPGRGVRRKLRRSTITSIGRAVLPSRRLWLSNGSSVVSSYNHLWLSQAYLGQKDDYKLQWNCTQDIKIGDSIRQLCSPWETLQTYEAGWLAGVLDGEGCVENYHGLRAGSSQKDNIVALQVRRILDVELGIIMTQSQNIESGVISFRPDRLLESISWEGVALPHHNASLKIVGIDELGDTEVVTVGTSTKTLIANGLISHNSPPFPALVCYRILASGEEIAGNWKWLLERKQIYMNAIQQKIVPPAKRFAEDWECKECRYALKCEVMIKGSA